MFFSSSFVMPRPADGAGKGGRAFGTMVVSSQETVDGARPAREAVDGRGMSSRCLDIEILYTVPVRVCVCVSVVVRCLRHSASCLVVS